MLFKGFAHANTTDKKETVLSITSSEEEPKRIVNVRITSETNLGWLDFAVERESLFHLGKLYQTGKAVIRNADMIFPINLDLPVGQTFNIYLQNVTAGVNAEIYGYIEYERI